MLSDEERAVLDVIRDARDRANSLPREPSGDTTLLAALDAALAALYARVGRRVEGNREQVEYETRHDVTVEPVTTTRGESP